MRALLADELCTMIDIAELRRLSGVAAQDGDDEPPECARCHVPMSIQDGAEPTLVCNSCAQDIVAVALPELLDRLEAAERDASINAGALDAQHHWHVRAEAAEAKVAALEAERDECFTCDMSDRIRQAVANERVLEGCGGCAERLTRSQDRGTPDREADREAGGEGEKPGE